MSDMLKSLKQFVEIAKGDEGRLNWFANQFSTIISRRLETEGTTVCARLGVIHEAIEIFSSVRPTLPNNSDDVEKLNKLLFIECTQVILSDAYQELDKHGDNLQLNSFKNIINRAVERLYGTGFSHRFELLKYLLENHWNHPVLQQLMLGLPCDNETALAFIECGETIEMLHVRVSLLLHKGYHDLALNLCNWCVRSRKYWYDSYLRAVQLHLLHSKGQMDTFTKQCQQLTCCKGLEMARQVIIDSELYLCLLQTVLVQDWLKPLKHCCTKELLGLWLEARYQVEESEQGFLESVSGLVQQGCSTWQLMSLIDVMHRKFGKHFMQFYLEVCLKVFRKDKAFLEEARGLRKQTVVESERSSLTYICTVLNCVSVNWSWRLRRLALLTAMSLEPSDQLMDLIDALYETTEEHHDCHLVENIDNVEVDIRGRSYRRKKLTKFELRAATVCSKDGYVFIPETPDKKLSGSKTIRRRMLTKEGDENSQVSSPSSSGQQESQTSTTKQQDASVTGFVKEETNANPNCVCHINDQCPCAKASTKHNVKLRDARCGKSEPDGTEALHQEGSSGKSESKYFSVRDVLPKTSQELLDVLNELLCPDLRPDQPFEDLYHKCESHLEPPPHCCLFEVFDGGVSPWRLDDDPDVELFNIRPEATKWVFDGDDLDAPEPVFERPGRGRKPKMVLQEHIELASSGTDNEELAQEATEIAEQEKFDKSRKKRGRPPGCKNKKNFRAIGVRRRSARLQHGLGRRVKPSGTGIVPSVKNKLGKGKVQSIKNKRKPRGKRKTQCCTRKLKPPGKGKLKSTKKNVDTQFECIQRRRIERQRRGRPRKKMVYEEVDDPSSDSDASTQYSSDTQVNSAGSDADEPPSECRRPARALENDAFIPDSTRFHTDSADLQRGTKRSENTVAPSNSHPDNCQPPTQALKHIVGELPQVRKKDVVHRETMFKHFDRICSKIKKGQMTTTTEKDSMKLPEGTNSQASGVGRELLSAVEEKRCSEVAPKDMRRTPLTCQPSRHANVLNSPNMVQGEKHQNNVAAANVSQHHAAKKDLPTSTPSAAAVTNSELKFQTWDAALRGMTTTSTSLGPVKDYRIPKTQGESQPPTSQAGPDLQHKPLRVDVARTINQQRNNAGTFPHEQEVARCAHVFQTVTSTASTVKQLASQPVHKAMVSPVVMDNTTKSPYSRIRDSAQYHTTVVPQYSNQHQNVEKSPSQRQPVPQSQPLPSILPGLPQRAASAKNTQVLRPSNVAHGQQTTPHVAIHNQVPNVNNSVTGTQMPPVLNAGHSREILGQVPKGSDAPTNVSFQSDTFLQTVNQRLPSNIKISKMPGQLPDNATRLPSSSAQVRAGQALSQHVPGGQNTVYLGSFVAEPDKPWPELPGPEVLSQFESMRGPIKNTVPQETSGGGVSSSRQVSQNRPIQNEQTGQRLDLSGLVQQDSQLLQIVQHQLQPHGANTVNSGPVGTLHFSQENVVPTQQVEYAGATQTSTLPQNVLQSDTSQQHGTPHAPGHTIPRGTNRPSPAHTSHSKQALAPPPQGVYLPYVQYKVTHNSGLEAYSTHHSPARPPAGGATTTLSSAQQQVPQMKDIEVQQREILSNLRRKVGLSGHLSETHSEHRLGSNAAHPAQQPGSTLQTLHSVSQGVSSATTGIQPRVSSQNMSPVANVPASVVQVANSEANSASLPTIIGQDNPAVPQPTNRRYTPPDEPKQYSSVLNSQKREPLSCASSHIGHVIQNIVRSENSRLKTSSSRNHQEKETSVPAQSATKSETEQRTSKNRSNPSQFQDFTAQNHQQRTSASVNKMQNSDQGPRKLDTTHKQHQDLKYKQSSALDEPVSRDKVIITIEDLDSQTKGEVEFQLEMSEKNRNSELGSATEDFTEPQAGSVSEAPMTIVTGQLQADGKTESNGNTKHKKGGTLEQDDTASVESAGSEGSSDALPREGRFKMMTLSPSSSSMQVLEGTNVDELLESLHSTEPKQVVRAQHLQVNKGESIEQVLMKLEQSASQPDKPTKATPGVKRSEKVPWGCSFKHGVYAVEINKDRTRKEKYHSKKISAEDLRKEPISELAGQDGVKVLVMQVKKSAAGSVTVAGRPIGSPAGMNTPLLSSASLREVVGQGDRSTLQQEPQDASTKSPATNTVREPHAPATGKHPSNTNQLGGGGLLHVVESSLPTFTCTSTASDNNAQQGLESCKVNATSQKGDGQSKVGPTTRLRDGTTTTINKSVSPEHVVTIRPQFGSRRLIPELATFSQKIQEAAANLPPVVGGPAALPMNTVKAVIASGEVRSTASAEDSKKGVVKVVLQRTGSSTTLQPDDNDLALQVRSAAAPLPGDVVFSVTGPAKAPHLAAESALLADINVVQNSTSTPSVSLKHGSARDTPQCVGDNETQVEIMGVPDNNRFRTRNAKQRPANAPELDTGISRTVAGNCQARLSQGTASVVNNIPAGAKFTKVVMHPNLTNIARIVEGVAPDAPKEMTHVAANRVSITHNVKLWNDVVETKLTSSSNVFQCKMCIKPVCSFFTMEETGRHITGKHSQVLGVQGGYLCPLCVNPWEVRYPSLDEIKQHMETRHGRAVSCDSSKETPVSLQADGAAPFKANSGDSSDDDEISFKLTSEEREKALSQQWQSSPEEQRPHQQSVPKKRGRPPKNANAAPVKADIRRKASRSPEVKTKYARLDNNKHLTQDTTRKQSSSPSHRGTKRRSSVSPTRNLSGRPARKNTLNQRLQQRRASQESPELFPGVEMRKRATSRDSNSSKGSHHGVATTGKDERTRNGAERQSRSTHRRGYPANSAAEGEGSDGAVDLNESEHVSVITRHKSPEVYHRKGKKRSFTDWAKHAEEQRKEWEEVIGSESTTNAKVKRSESEEKLETEDVKRDVQRMSCSDRTADSQVIRQELQLKNQTVPESVIEVTQSKSDSIGVNVVENALSGNLEEVRTVEKRSTDVDDDKEVIAAKQLKKSPVRSPANPSNKKISVGSPRRITNKALVSPEGLWTGNLRPGQRDWVKVKTYERRKKNKDKLDSITRSRSEDEQLVSDKHEMKTSATSKEASRAGEEDLKSCPRNTEECDVKNEKVPRSPERTGMKSDGRSSVSPRTPPCAVSITRLRIQSVEDVFSSTSSPCRKLDPNTLTESRVKSKPTEPGLKSDTAMLTVKPCTNASAVRSEPEENVAVGMRRGNRTSSVSSVSEDSGLAQRRDTRSGSVTPMPPEEWVRALRESRSSVSSVHSEGDRGSKQLTSPPRVTRSKATNDLDSPPSQSTRDASVKTRDSESMLKGKARPLVIGGQVIGKPISDQLNSRRSTRTPSAKDASDDRKSTSGRKR